MAQQFNLTAQINLQSPKNVGRVVSDIQRQLKGSGLNTVNIKVKADPRSMAQTNRQLQNVSKNSRAAAKDIGTLNRNLQEATRRFSVITLATGGLLSLVTGFKNATKASIEFERELLKISQVTGKSVKQLEGLTKEVTRLSTAFGVSSADLLNVSRTLAQAGFNAENTRKSLDILAKTTLAATFDNIQDTTEGAIALLRQFGDEAKRTGGDVAFLEKSLDAINSVSKKFAVESGDLITVIRRVGGVFSAAGGSVNELIALFTSVRATTRESAETIATGLRTIFTRIQRPETVQQLKALNIQLADSQGQFVGAFEAVKRLSQGLSALNPRDFRFSQIVEELGGFRQIGKVIPLIQQFATAQQALSVAQNASGSTAKDAATAQQGLGNEIVKVKEEFTALIRKFTDSGPFNSIATGALKIASAMIKVMEAVEPLLPLLITMFGLKIGKALAPGVGRLAGIGRSAAGGAGGGGGFSRFNRGGMVPGSGNRDTVPAMLTPGEFVIRKSSVEKLGADRLQQMNNNRFKGGNNKKGVTKDQGKDKKRGRFRLLPSKGQTHFSHLDKMGEPSRNFQSLLSKKDPNIKARAVYSNFGIDIPGTWNMDWGQQRGGTFLRDNEGATKSALASFVKDRDIFKSLKERKKPYKFRGEGSEEAQSIIQDKKKMKEVRKSFANKIRLSSIDNFDVDPDVIRADVGGMLLQSFRDVPGVKSTKVIPFFKQASAYRLEGGSRRRSVSGVGLEEGGLEAASETRRRRVLPSRDLTDSDRTARLNTLRIQEYVKDLESETGNKLTSQQLLGPPHFEKLRKKLGGFRGDDGDAKLKRVILAPRFANGGQVRGIQKFSKGGSPKKNAYIFDFDDTLATTEAKSFKDFSNPDFIESASATRYASLAKRRAAQGDDVHVLTARSGSKAIRGAIASFMAKNGIATKSIMGVGKAFPNEREPGKRPGTTRKLSTASKKQKVLENLAKRYGQITFLDDNIENILQASKVKNVRAVTAEKEKLFKNFGVGGKVGVFDSDMIQDKKQAAAIRQSIIDSKKLKKLIWGPAGSGKTTYAKDMYGDNFVKSMDHLAEYDDFIVLSGAQTTKKSTKVGEKDVNLSQTTVDLIREAKEITAIIPEQQLLISRREKRIANPESVRSMGDLRSEGSLKATLKLAGESQANEILKTFQTLKSGISVLRPTMANPSGKTIEATAGAVASAGGRILGTTSKTKDLTLEEAVAAGLKRSTLTPAYGKDAVDAFFGGTAAENQAAKRKAEGVSRKRKGATDSNLTYGAAFLEKVTSSTSGERSVDVDGKKILYDFKTAYVDASDAKKIKDDYVVPQAKKAVQSIASLFANSVGATAQKSDNIPNLPAITGSLYEAGLARVIGGGIADDADDNRIFDFPSGLKDAAGIFGADGKALQNVKTDAKVASSSSALKSIRAKVKNDLSKNKFAKGGAAPSDTVPALLTPGEFVFSADSAKKIGYANLNRMNKQGVQGYAAGGVVSTGQPAGGRATSSRSLYGSATPTDGLRSFNSGVIKGKADTLVKQLEKVAKNFQLLGLKGSDLSTAMQIAEKDLKDGSGKMKTAYEKGATSVQGAGILKGPEGFEGTRGMASARPELGAPVTSFIGGKGDRTKSTQANNLVSDFGQSVAGSANVDMSKVEKAYQDELEKSGSSIAATDKARKETVRKITETNGIRKRQAAEMKKTLQERKNTPKGIKLVNGARKSLIGAMQKAQNAYSSVQKGGASVGQKIGQSRAAVAIKAGGAEGFADRANAISNTAQSFVFLGSMVGSVTSQMSSLDEATKKAFNETAAFASGIVGVGGTVVQTLTSMATSSTQSAIADQLEAGSSEKAAAANAAAGSKLATGLGMAAISVVAVISVLKFFAAKAKAEADIISKARDKEVDAIKKSGGTANTASLQKGLSDELKLRDESAKLSSASALATAGAYAAAGAAVGSIIPVFGTAVGGLIGGIAGGLAGYYQVTSDATNAVAAAANEREKEARSIREVYEAQIRLAQSTYGLTSSLNAIESAPGLSNTQKIRKRLEAQQQGSGEALQTVTEIRKKTKADADTLGVSESQLSSLDEEGIRKIAGDKNLSQTETDAIVIRNAAAFKTLEEAAKLAALRVSETGKTLQQSISGLQAGDSREAIESQKLFAQSTNAARQAIIEERDAKANAALTEEAKAQALEEGNLKLSSFNEGIVSITKAKQAEFIATQRAAKAQIAITKAIERTDKFLKELSGVEIRLDKQQTALDNFAAVVDNAAIKIKASGVDEIENVGSVKDLNKFANQITSLTAKFGPEAKRVGSELAQSASVLKNARSLIGKNFSIGDPINPAQILNSLGLTPSLLGPGGKAIFDQIAAALRESKGVLKEEDIASIFGPLQQLGQKNAEVIKRLIGVNQKEIDNYQKYLDVKEKLRNREVEQKTKEIEALQQGLKLRQQADALVRKSQGLSEDPVTAARQTRSQNSAARISRNQAQLQGITVGGKQVNSSNVGQVAAIRANAIRERRQIAGRISGGENSKELIKRQKQLQVVIGSTTKVLESFADSGEKAQDIFTEMEANISVIEKERQKREQMLAVVEEFVVGGEDARKNLVMASRGIRQAFAVGSLQMQSPEQRQATVGLLDQLSDVVLMGGMTGQQIKQELVVRDAIRMGLDPNIAKQLATATTTEQKLIQANKNLALEIHQLTLETINSRKALADPKPAGGKATGGLVQYRSGGGTIFKPKGTDTVPAMLTPGEFVIRKSAVDKIGADNLAAMNRGGSVIYRHGGGITDSKGNEVFHQHRSRMMNDDDMISGSNIGENQAHEPFHANDRPIQKQDGTPPGIPQTATGVDKEREFKLKNSGGGAGFSGSRQVRPPNPDVYATRPVGPNGEPVQGPAETDSGFQRRNQEFYKYAYRDQGLIDRGEDFMRRLTGIGPGGKTQRDINKKRSYAQPVGSVPSPMLSAGEAIYNTFAFAKSLFSSGEPATKPAAPNATWQPPPAAPKRKPIDPTLPDPLGGMVGKSYRIPMPPMPSLPPVDERVDVSGQLGPDLVDIKPPNLTKAATDGFQRFTDVTGQYATRAKIVDVKGRNVILEKPDGSTVSVPIDKLSDRSKAIGSAWFREQSQRDRERMTGVTRMDKDILAREAPEPSKPWEEFEAAKRFTYTIPPNLGSGVTYRQFGGGIGYGRGGYGAGNTGRMQAARGNQFMMQRFQQGNQFMNQRYQQGMNFMNNMRNEALSYSIGPGMRYTGVAGRNTGRRGGAATSFSRGAQIWINGTLDRKKTVIYNRTLQQLGPAAATEYLNRLGNNAELVAPGGGAAAGGAAAGGAAAGGAAAGGAAAGGGGIFRQNVVNALIQAQRRGIPLKDAADMLNERFPNSTPVSRKEKRFAKQGFTAGLGRPQGPQNRGGVRPLARGGVVPSYFSSGGMNQDTVPAMLTPGEFVMSQDAVKKHGIAAMQSLNQGNVPGFNRGGMVGGVQYRQNGGLMGMIGGAAQALGIDTKEISSTFDNFVGNFSGVLDNITTAFSPITSAIQNLANIFGGSEGIKMTHNHTVTIAAGEAKKANLTEDDKKDIAMAVYDYAKNKSPNPNDFKGLA